MEIKMTEKQFRRLLDLVYIGNWILNSTRGDDRIRQYDEVESLVFSQCLAHGMAPLTELYQGELIPSRAFAEGGIHEAIMAYEDNTFFEILAQELALRDMDDPPITEENYDEVMSRMDEYLGEFERHGTDNITVARQYYPDANMGVLPLPSSADGAPSFRVGEGDAWGVWKDTENEAACWALLDYLARPEVGSKWATVSGALPTVEGADAADVYTLNCYKQAVEDCNGKVQYDNLFDRKFFPSGMWGIMADSMSMMLSNPDDVTEAVEYLRDNYLELYAEQNG